tara:strand:+ start:165 stop:365 length:201 start_codon:yes stop_codon:yes gene_type:complete
LENKKMVRVYENEHDQWDGYTKEEFLDIHGGNCFFCKEELCEEAILANSDECIKCFTKNNPDDGEQ